MVITKKFNSIAAIQALQKIACDVPDSVQIHNLEGDKMVDAKSFIGLFTLDFSKEVKIVTDSEYVIKELEKLN